MKPPRQDRSRETHHRIVDAAARLLAKGRVWSEISVAELVEEAGASVGAFYHRFRDKDALLHVMQIELYQQGEATAVSAAALGGEAVPLDALIRSFVTLAVASYREQAGLRRALLVQMSTDGRFRERAQELSRATCEMLTTMLGARYPRIERERLRLTVDIAHRMVYATLDQNLMFADRPTEHRIDDVTLIEELSLALGTYVAAKLG